MEILIKWAWNEYCYLIIDIKWLLVSFRQQFQSVKLYTAWCRSLPTLFCGSRKTKNETTIWIGILHGTSWAHSIELRVHSNPSLSANIFPRNTISTRARTAPLWHHSIFESFFNFIFTNLSIDGGIQKTKSNKQNWRKAKKYKLICCNGMLESAQLRPTFKCVVIEF